MVRSSPQYSRSLLLVKPATCEACYTWSLLLVNPDGCVMFWMFNGVHKGSFTDGSGLVPALQVAGFGFEEVMCCDSLGGTVVGFQDWGLGLRPKQLSQECGDACWCSAS